MKIHDILIIILLVFAIILTAISILVILDFVNVGKCLVDKSGYYVHYVRKG